MNDWFEWNGVKCTSLGIHVSEHPPITIPEERVTFTDVPGRSGSLTTTEGMDVYNDITLTAECMIRDTEPALCTLHRYRDDSKENILGGAVSDILNLKRSTGTPSTQQMHVAWCSLYSGIATLTCRLSEQGITEEMRVTMLCFLYMSYDTTRDFCEQVEENKALIKSVFWDRFKRKLSFRDCLI